jgi:hypothetical protein
MPESFRHPHKKTLSFYVDALARFFVNGFPLKTLKKRAAAKAAQAAAAGCPRIPKKT